MLKPQKYITERLIAAFLDVVCLLLLVLACYYAVMGRCFNTALLALAVWLVRKGT